MAEAVSQRRRSSEPGQSVWIDDLSRDPIESGEPTSLLGGLDAKVSSLNAAAGVRR